MPTHSTSPRTRRNRSVAQYPLEMGKPDSIRSSKTLAVSMNAEGHVAYDALVKQGSNRGKTVYADHRALVPKVDKLSKEVRARCAPLHTPAC